jgi:type I restriction-modification system DNA methylase subunit
MTVVSKSRTEHAMNLLNALVASKDGNETAKKELLVSYLRSIFPEAEYRPYIDSLAAGAETYVKTMPSELSKSTWGFIDTRHGQLIIEFKANLSDSGAMNTALLELRRYVASLWSSQGQASSFCCIATDVIEWKVFAPVPRAISSTGIYSAEDVDLIEAEYFRATPNETAAEHLVRLLERVLFEQNLMPLTGENLKRDFGYTSSLYRLVKPAVVAQVQNAKKETEISLAIDLWHEFQTYNPQSKDKDDSLDNYVDQLYLVLLSRFIVAAFFDDEPRELSDETLQNILTGDFFVFRLKLSNLVETDFFAWITKKPYVLDLMPFARQLYHQLRTYDLSAAERNNVLHNIYDELMPDTQSDLLGQRSTPHMLVEETVAHIFEVAPKTMSFLDPACGSGTFLREGVSQLLRNNTKLSNSEKLQLVSANIVGIDVDPVSVLISRAVWVMAVAELLAEAEGLTTIPVYHADALFIASDVTAGENDIYIEFDDTRIIVPNEILFSPGVFDRFVSWANEIAESIAIAHENMKEITFPEASTFNIRAGIHELSNSDEQLIERVQEALAELINQLARRMHAKRDGIWAFILRNTYRPALFAGKFDAIATNPPWLSMSSLPDIPYKKRLNALAGKFNIKPSGASFLHTEIATTFMLHNVDYFLKPSGRAAFVLPRSIFDGDHHDKFRRVEYLNHVDLTISEVWDLKTVASLFRVPCCIVFCEKLVPAKNATFPTLNFGATFDRQKATESILGVQILGEKSAWSSAEEVIETSMYYGQRFKQGADLMPRTAIFIEYGDPNPGREIVRIRTRHSEVHNPNGKVLKGVTFEGLSRNKYIFETVTSGAVVPFGIIESEKAKVCLPLRAETTGFSVVSKADMLSQGETETASWFDAIDAKLPGSKLRARVDTRSKLTRQDYVAPKYIVHSTAGGSHPCAAIEILSEKGFRFVADQTTYVYATEDGNESKYLAAMINSPALAEAINVFQAKGLFGARHIHTLIFSLIPAFDPENATHQKLSVLGGDAIRRLDPKIVTLDATTRDIVDPVRRMNRRRELTRRILSAELGEINEISSRLIHAKD